MKLGKIKPKKKSNNESIDIGPINNIKATDMPAKVVIISKKFYDDLINLDKKKEKKVIKDLQKSCHLTVNQISTKMKRGVDYEIIDDKLWSKITKKYGYFPKIGAYFIKNPNSGEEMLLFPYLESILFNFYLPIKRPFSDSYTLLPDPIEYCCQSEWMLEDIRRKICLYYNLNVDIFHFTCHNIISPINENYKMSQVLMLYGKELDLRQDMLSSSIPLNPYNNEKKFSSMKMHRNPNKSSHASKEYKEAVSVNIKQACEESSKIEQSESNIANQSFMPGYASHQPIEPKALCSKANDKEQLCSQPNEPVSIESQESVSTFKCNESSAMCSKQVISGQPINPFFAKRMINTKSALNQSSDPFASSSSFSSSQSSEMFMSSQQNDLKTMSNRPCDPFASGQSNDLLNGPLDSSQLGNSFASNQSNELFTSNQQNDLKAMSNLPRDPFASNQSNELFKSNQQNDLKAMSNMPSDPFASNPFNEQKNIISQPYGQFNSNHSNGLFMQNQQNDFKTMPNLPDDPFASNQLNDPFASNQSNEMPNSNQQNDFKTMQNDPFAANLSSDQKATFAQSNDPFASNQQFVSNQSNDPFASNQQFASSQSNDPFVSSQQSELNEMPLNIQQSAPPFIPNQPQDPASVCSQNFTPQNQSASASNLMVPKPVGLHDFGNTCFFNAAVQVLARVMPLTSFILSDQFQYQINRNNPNSSQGQIALSYRRFLEDLCNGSADLNDLREAVIQKYNRFSNHAQHDSQELLLSLLDGLHEDMNQSFYVNGRNSPPEKLNESNGWDSYISHNSSPIVDIFNGALYGSVICPDCGFIEKVYDPFIFLSIPIPRKFSTVTLHDCLVNFSKREALDDGNEWRCDRCHQLVCADKQIGVEKCGKVLIIYLKRFSGDGQFMSKINTNVDYPDVLNVESFASNDRGRFNLIGVVFHSGGTGGGHYTSAAIDPLSKCWYFFSDSYVTKIERERIHTREAYILFYQRQE